MGIIEKFWKLQEKVQERTKYIGRGRYGRVLKMARKPEPDEFSRTSLVVGIGILLLGALGFVIFLLWKHVPPFFADLLGL